MPDEPEPQPHLGCRAGEEEDHPADKRRERKQRGGRNRNPTARYACGARHLRPAARKLAEAKEHERNRQRKKKIDDAKHDHGAEEARRFCVAVEQRDKRELEHAEAAGNVAHESRHLRQCKCAEHHAERQARRRERKNRPEHGGHEDPVDDRDRGLRKRHPPRRRHELPSENPNRPSEPRARQQVAENQQQEKRTHRSQAGERHAEECHRPDRREQQRSAGHGEHTQPEGGRVECDRQRDIRGRQSGGVVKPVSEPASEDQRKTQRV